MIDKNIFQILLTDASEEPPLPVEMQRNVASWRDLYPDHAYSRLDGAGLEAFIAANFATEVLDAYRVLKPYSYRADLGRYCLLLVRGGIYADMSLRLLARPTPAPYKRMVCFRDMPSSGLWTVSNGFIMAEAGRPEFKLAIEMICRNVRERYYGADSLHPTGPALFGRAIAEHDRLDEIDFGAFDFLANSRNPHNLGYLDATGRIVCLRMKSGAFSEFGIPGTNDYYRIWTRRQVYHEERVCFHASTLYVVAGPSGAARSADGVRYDATTTGFVVFGPHSVLSRGRYRATYLLSPDSDLAGMTIDVLVGHNESFRVLVQRPLDEGEARRASIEFWIEVEMVYQVRLFSVGGIEGLVQGLEVEALS